MTSEQIYSKNLSLVKSLAKKYAQLDPSLSPEDLENEGFLAVIDALKTYDTRKKMEFSTYLYWHLQKRFQKLAGDDKVVEVQYENGKIEIFSFRQFQRVKRTLPEGVTYRISSLLTSLEDLKEREGNGGEESYPTRSHGL